jgi:hypothetical protein
MAVTATNCTVIRLENLMCQSPSGPPDTRLPSLEPILSRAATCLPIPESPFNVIHLSPLIGVPVLSPRRLDLEIGLSGHPCSWETCSPSRPSPPLIDVQASASLRRAVACRFLVLVPASGQGRCGPRTTRRVEPWRGDDEIEVEDEDAILTEVSEQPPYRGLLRSDP